MDDARRDLSGDFGACLVVPDDGFVDVEPGEIFVEEGDGSTGVRIRGDDDGLILTDRRLGDAWKALPAWLF